MLKLHGAAAFVALIAMGAMSAHHVRRGCAVARDRMSGALVISFLVALIASGYPLDYLVGDASRASISFAHWPIGVALAPVLAMHIVIGRQCITKKEAARSSAR